MIGGVIRQFSLSTQYESVEENLFLLTGGDVKERRTAGARRVGLWVSTFWIEKANDTMKTPKSALRCISAEILATSFAAINDFIHKIVTSTDLLALVLWQKLVLWKTEILALVPLVLAINSFLKIIVIAIKINYLTILNYGIMMLDIRSFSV